MKHLPTKEGWEEEFDKRFFEGNWERFKRQDPHVIKLFIRSLLQQQKKEILEEIGKLREENHCWYMHDEDGACLNDECRNHGPCSLYCPGRKNANQVIDQIKSIIEKL